MGLSEVAEGFSGRLGVWHSCGEEPGCNLHGLDLLLRIDSSDGRSNAPSTG